MVLTNSDLHSAFLDVYILMEIFFHRSQAGTVAQWLDSNGKTLVTSALAVDLVMYFIERKHQSKDLGRQFLQQYQVLSLTANDVNWAYQHDAGDFEDALQIACALRHGCQQFVTLNHKVRPMYGQYIDIVTINGVS